MKYLLPPMQTLRTFEALGRLRNFSRVAEELHLTPSAVSHQIKAIETFYGLALFRRSHRDVALTPAGERLMAVVQTTLRQLSDAGEQLRRRDGNRLSISVPPSLASRWLLQQLGAFLRERPEIDFTLHTTTSLVDLDADEVDLAIRFGGGRWPGVRSEKLFDEELFPVATPGYVTRMRLRKPADLERCVLLRDDFGAWPEWLESAGGTGGKYVFGPSFNDSALLLQAAEAGAGVALARSRLVTDAIAAGTLKRVGNVAIPSRGSYYLVTSSRRPQAASVMDFSRWLADQRLRETAAPQL